MDKVKVIVDTLRGRLNNAGNILSEYREKTGMVAAGAFCETIPPEVALAAGISIFFVPMEYQVSIMQKNENYESSIDWLNDNYDLIITPICLENMTMNLEGKGLRVHGVNIPDGWGEETSVSLHNEMITLFEKTGHHFDPLHSVEQLQESCMQHDTIRKIVRGIAAARAGNRDLLSNSDLQVIFESASCLPHEYIIEELSSILGRLHKNHAEENADFNIMIYGGMNLKGVLLDEIESCGSVVIAEDDCCMGRRRFDMSLNCQSANLYYELLDLYSYKPYCPRLRPVDERYQLLYKLLKNYNINLVLLIDDSLCEARNDHSEYLYRKLRQDGIDTVKAGEDNAVNVVGEYIDRYKKGMRLFISIPHDI